MIYNKSIYFDTKEKKDFLENVAPQTLDNSLSIMETAFQLISENETNWKNIEMAIAINELAYLEENSKEIIYEAEKEKSKSTHNTFVASLQNIFSKIIAFIDSIIIKITDVITKYTVDLVKIKTVAEKGEKNIPEDGEFKGHQLSSTIADKIEKLTSINIVSPLDAAAYNSKNVDDDIKEAKDTITAQLYGIYDIGEHDGIKGVRYNILGEEKDILHDKKLFTYQNSIDNIALCKSVLNNLKQYKNNVKNMINNAIKSIEKHAKSAEKDNIDNSLKNSKLLVQAINEVTSTLIAIIGVNAESMKIIIRESYAIIKRLASYGTKSKAEDKTDDINVSNESSLLFKDAELLPGVTFI